MKTRIATLMLVLSGFLGSTAFANDPTPASKIVTHSVAKMIEKELKYPEFAIEENLECYVMISLVIQDNGTFKVNCSNCMDYRMKKYVIKEIESFQPDDFTQYSGQRVLLKITFDLILV